MKLLSDVPPLAPAPRVDAGDMNDGKIFLHSRKLKKMKKKNELLFPLQFSCLTCFCHSPKTSR